MVFAARLNRVTSYPASRTLFAERRTMTNEPGVAEIRITVSGAEPVIVTFDPKVTVAPGPAADAEDQPKVKASFYQTRAAAGRMRAAYVATQAMERHRSLSAFIQHAVGLELERLENLYNDGAPWPSLEAGEIPKGAPLRM
jgi:hypothetical protein